MKTIGGFMACFTDPDKFLEGLRRVQEAGYRKVKTYTPYAVEGLEEYLPHRRSPVPKLVFCGGLAGGIGGFALQWWAVHDYPFEVAGRPLNSWPAFIPVTFELTVLCAAITGVLSLLFLARLPRLDHPVFSDPRFFRASQDRFFLCIQKTDTKFDAAGTRRFLESLPAESVAEVRL